MNHVRHLLGTPRRLARAVRHLPDRLLHPSRRHRAVAGLRALTPAGTVLFICHGNICRSPYAAAVFHRSLPLALRPTCIIRQAGLYDHDRVSPDAAVEAASIRGIDLSEHRSTFLSPEVAAGVTLYVVMSLEQQRAVRSQFHLPRSKVLILGDLDPQPIKTRTIMDPYAHSEEVFQASFARIDRCIEVLVRALTYTGATSPELPLATKAFTL